MDAFAKKDSNEITKEFVYQKRNAVQGRMGTFINQKNTKTLKKIIFKSIEIIKTILTTYEFSMTQLQLYLSYP